MTKKEELKALLKEQAKNRNILMLSGLPSPELIPNMRPAAEHIVKRLMSGDRMLIVGDYDCDGIMATTIMYDFFRKVGFGSLVDYIVPDRFVDGYGVSRNIIDHAISNGFDFIVTVDNGIGAVDAINYANENGIEVIITDHHTVGEEVPNSEYIVNLKYELGEFPFMEITGATISWYMCSMINMIINAGIDMRQWLDLVGITVLSDVMPLRSLNVTLYRYALRAIDRGDRYLYDIIFDRYKKVYLTETDIAFELVPMINAVGRLDHAKNVIEILLSNDRSEIKKGFFYLKEVNNRRKALTQELLSKIMPQVLEQVESGAQAIIVKEPDLHEGIVGILAGQIAEKFMRPAYVFGWNSAKQCWKGSGRTSGSIQLYDLTAKAAKYALGFGGHAGAVGVALSNTDFSKWSDLIKEESKKFDSKDFLPLGEKPIELPLSEVDQDLMDIINTYRPYGQGFPMPRFKTKAFMYVLESYKEGLHWKCCFIDMSGASINGFIFHDKNVSQFHNGEIDIIYEPVLEMTNKGPVINIRAQVNYLGV